MVSCLDQTEKALVGHDQVSDLVEVIWRRWGHQLVVRRHFRLAIQFRYFCSSELQLLPYCRTVKAGLVPVRHIQTEQRSDADTSEPLQGFVQAEKVELLLTVIVVVGRPQPPHAWSEVCRVRGHPPLLSRVCI